MNAILGICAYIHDSSAALVIGNRLIGCMEEDKLLDQKHTGQFPSTVVSWLLRRAGISRDEVSRVAYYMSGSRFAWAAARTLGTARRLRELPDTARLARYYAKIAVRHRLRIAQLRSEFPRATVVDVPHHLCHALYAFHASPWDRAAVLTIDSIGEGDTAVIHRVDSGRHERLLEIRDPHSLGYLYGAMTQHLGFRRNDEEGSVMALASYGDPARYRDVLREVLHLEADGFRIDPQLIPNRAVASPLGRRTSLQFDRRAFRPRQAGEPIEQHHIDLAASLQERTCEAVLHLARLARRLTNERKLCFAGGVALNCVAAGELRASMIFDDVFIPPAPGDSGTALGAALAQLREHHTVAPGFASSAQLGIAYDEGEITRSLDRAGLPYQRIADPIETASQILAAGKILGLFHGAAELGPRALGARSILALPKDAAMRNRINECVKYREWFRPCAPVIMRERVDQWFERDCDSPYMSFALRVRSDRRDLIPAVVHVDGTARLQTVRAADHPFLHELLRAVEQRSGIPILLNTSLNLKGHPTAATIASALHCFRESELDHLLMDGILVNRADRI